MVNNSGAARELTQERNQWMAGLTDFAKRRMSRVAIVRMLQQWNIGVPSWLVEDKGCEVSWNQTSLVGQSALDGSEGQLDPKNTPPRTIKGEYATGKGDDVNRTVLNISLDSGYIDSYAFVHAAWMAIQEEEANSTTYTSETT
jgi:hypothetical protein